MKKAFTLIELLAVILILGVIALIAVPVVSNIIKESKKKSALVSASNYINAVEKKLLHNQLIGDKTITTGTYEISEFTSLLDLKGTKPTKGSVNIGSNNLVKYATFCINNYKVDYNEDKAKIYDYTSCDDMTSSTYGFDETKGVNKPVLAAGMTPVKWDASNNEIITNESDSSWYDYANKKWANAKTKDGSYWVWIPRYAYKITSGYHSSTTGTIDIKFLKGTTNIANDNTKIENSGYIAGTKDTSTNYFMHPAFNFGGNILGYWVAKFEPTSSEGVANGFVSDNSCPSAADNVTTKTVKIVPNAISWRCIDIKNTYNLTANMKDGLVYGWNSNNVDTHMMKNTEWSAVIYLTQSNYGASTEVWINNANNYMTGCAGNSFNQNASTTGCQNSYSTANGVKASTTSNITGIYDMSGGAWERTMSNYNNLANGGFTTTEIANIPNKNINRYNTPTINLLNGIGLDYDISVYGDAMYETSGTAARFNGSNFVGTQNASWYSDKSNIPHITSPFFIRGSYFNDAFNAGIFSFHGAAGTMAGYITFRPVVAVVD